MGVCGAKGSSKIPLIKGGRSFFKGHHLLEETDGEVRHQSVVRRLLVNNPSGLCKFKQVQPCCRARCCPSTMPCRLQRWRLPPNKPNTPTKTPPPSGVEGRLQIHPHHLHMGAGVIPFWDPRPPPAPTRPLLVEAGAWPRLQQRPRPLDHWLILPIWAGVEMECRGVAPIPLIHPIPTRGFLLTPTTPFIPIITPPSGGHTQWSLHAPDSYSRCHG